MNYLAHAYLSGESEKILVGNMMGDAIKGYVFLDEYEKEVSDGIVLHRFIDEFMDQHKMTKIGRKRIWEHYRHYSGVVMDMYYDHMLAKNWADYSEVPLNHFAQNTYSILQKNWSILPEETQYLCRHMIANDWLSNYGDLRAMERTFSGLSRRTKFVSNMENAVADLYLHFDSFENEFKQFFAEAIEACRHKRKTQALD